jgi:hypothetical protein
MCIRLSSLQAENELERITNPWTQDEQRIFAEKYLQYNKDFRRIATFLRNRTVADCIVYYYKRQKDDNGFRCVSPRVRLAYRTYRVVTSAQYPLYCAV